MVNAVKDEYPYYASFQDLDEYPSIDRACSPKDLGAYTTCTENCVNEGGCDLHTCEAVVSQPCLTCIAMELVQEVDTLTYCLTIPKNEYVDSFGVLLLSRFPLSDVITKPYVDVDYGSTVVPRKGYITAKVHCVICNVPSHVFNMQF